MAKYKIGDQVSLISGGPVMTVMAVIETTGDVQCIWFEPSAHEYKKINIPGDALEAAKEKREKKGPNVK